MHSRREGQSSEYIEKLGKTVQELFISLSDRENLNRFPSDIPEAPLKSKAVFFATANGLCLLGRKELQVRWATTTLACLAQGGFVWIGNRPVAVAVKTTKKQGVKQRLEIGRKIGNSPIRM